MKKIKPKMFQRIITNGKRFNQLIALMAHRDFHGNSPLLKNVIQELRSEWELESLLIRKQLQDTP